MPQTWHACAWKAGRHFRKVITPRTVMGSSPCQGGSFSSETKHDTHNGAKTKVDCLGKEITGIRITNPKICPGFE
jgi:hypothetical protein